MNSIWKSLEELPTGIGVAADWQYFTGAAWPAFRAGFLDQRSAPALAYRCPRECGCAHRVVHQADRSIVAVAGQRGRRSIQVKIAAVKTDTAAHQNILGRLGRVFGNQNAEPRGGGRAAVGAGVPSALN